MQKERSDVFTRQLRARPERHQPIRNTLRYTDSTQKYIWAQPDDSKGNVASGQVFRRYNTRHSATQTWQNVSELTGQSNWLGLKAALPSAQKLHTKPRVRQLLRHRI